MLARKRIQHVHRLISFTEVAVFIILVSFLLILFFPENTLESHFSQSTQYNEVMTGYLTNLLGKQPDNPRYRIWLAKQLLDKGQFLNAQKVLSPLIKKPDDLNAKWQAQWISYKITQQQAYALPSGSARRKKLIAEMQAMLPQFLAMPDSLRRSLTTPLSIANRISLANDATLMDKPKLALQFYIQLAQDKAYDSHPEFLPSAGRAALAVNNTIAAAKFYLLAQQQAKSLDAQRHYFLEGMKSFIAGNHLDMALEYANEYINTLADDHETLVFLNRLALAADNPKLAQEYALRVIRLKQQRQP